MYMEYPQAKNGLGEIDWSGIIKDITGGVVAVKTIQAQTKAAQAAAALQPGMMPSVMGPGGMTIPYQYNPQYSPQYTTPQQPSNIMPVLLLGGAALVLFFMLKD